MKLKRSLVIIDDEKHVVNRLALGFDWEALGFQVIGVFTDSATALEQIPLMNPDVIVSDIKMPHYTGLELMNKLQILNSEVKFIFISGYADFKYIHEAIKHGASGYCLKPLQDEELTEILIQIGNALDEEDLNLSFLIEAILSSHEKDDSQLLVHKLQQISFLSNSFYILASFGDISDELNHLVNFKRINYDNNVFLYFVNNSPFIESQGFQNRIKQKLINREIKSYYYTKIIDYKNLSNKISDLINASYQSFVEVDYNVLSSFALPKAHNLKSNFYITLEKAFGKHNLNDILATLNTWKTSYDMNDRNIIEAINIYNLVMTLIYQQTNMYFKENFTKPYELANSFSNLQQMMKYLTEQISNLIMSNIGLNIDQLKNDTFKNIIEYINNNYSKSITFQGVSMLYSIAPSYLCQIFQRELNTTFTKYLTKLRLSKAKTLLIDTNLPITDISNECGFEQYYYFARVFKKDIGITPTQYRDNNKHNKLEKYGILSEF